MPPAVSVVIPVRDAASGIEATLESVRRQDPPVMETIVVDGGSADGTREVAGSLGANVVRGPVGRGAQLAMGAECAAGEVLLFLHGDSVLPDGAVRALTVALEDPDVVGEVPHCL